MFDVLCHCDCGGTQCRKFLLTMKTANVRQSVNAIECNERTRRGEKRRGLVEQGGKREGEVFGEATISSELPKTASFVLKCGKQVCQRN